MPFSLPPHGRYNRDDRSTTRDGMVKQTSCLHQQDSDFQPLKLPRLLERKFGSPCVHWWNKQPNRVISLRARSTQLESHHTDNGSRSTLADQSHRREKWFKTNSIGNLLVEFFYLAHALMALLKLITSGFKPLLRIKPNTASASIGRPACLHAPITELNVTTLGATPWCLSICRVRDSASRHSPARSWALITQL